jgi:hypothetical protein
MLIAHCSISAQVQDKAYYCEKRREKLLEHVNQGYDQDWWKFTVPVEL